MDTQCGIKVYNISAHPVLSASFSLARTAAVSLVVVVNAILVVDVAREKVVTVEVAREMVVVLVEAASEVHYVKTYIFSCYRQPQICIWGSSYARSDIAYQSFP